MSKIIRLALSCDTSKDGGSGALYILNDGTETLTVSGITSSNAHFFVRQTTASIPAGLSTIVPVDYDSGAAGATVTLTVTSDKTAGTNTVSHTVDSDPSAPVSGRLISKGTITLVNYDADFPAANNGDIYQIAGSVSPVTGAGTVGGMLVVRPGDFIICNVDNSPAGTGPFISPNWSSWIHNANEREYLANKSTDTTLGNSDVLYPSQKAVKSYVDTAISGLPTPMAYKGDIDCSANPNFPAASAGNTYVVSAAGKIGGASGASVELWDSLVCRETTAAGDFATVGSKWAILQANLNGAVTGPSSATDGAAVRFDGTSGKLVKSSGLVIGDLGNLTLAGNDTSGLDGILMNPSAKTSGNFIKAQIAGGSTLFSVNYAGQVNATGNIYTNNGILGCSNGTNQLMLYPYNGGNCGSGATGLTAVSVGNGSGPTNIRTGGTNKWLSVEARYNQASGSAENWDLFVNRTEVAVGSGAQYSQGWAVGGTVHSSLTKLGLLTLGVGVNKVLNQRTSTGLLVWSGTQAQYDALTPVSGTLYFIAG